MGGSIEIQAATGAAPGLDPGSIVASGLSAGSPHEAAGQAMATGGYASATKTADALDKLDTSAQRSYWGDLNAQQQGLLKSVGYRVPADLATLGDHPSSLWGDIMGPARDIAHGIMTGVHAVGHVGSDVLNAGWSGIHAVQHITRATQVLHETDQTGGITDPKSWEALFSPSAWSRAWNATTNGARTFDPLVERQIRQSTDPTTFAMAKDLASGVPEQEIVASFPQAQRQAVVQFLTTGNVRKVASELNNAHITFGQEVVGESLLNSHPLLGHILSGSLDAAFDIGTDPIGGALKVLPATQIARWGLTDSRVSAFAGTDTTAFEQFQKTGAGSRWIQTYGNLIEQRGLGALSAVNPKLAAVANELGAAGVHDAPSLAEWTRNVAGQRAILEGRAATMVHATPIMPHLSIAGWARFQAKDALSQSIDWLADRPKGLSSLPLARDDMEHAGPASEMALDAMKALPKSLDELAPVDESPAEVKLGSRTSRLVLGGPSAAARVFRRLTTITSTVPSLDMNDPAAAVELRRTLGGFLAKQQVDQIVDVFVNTHEDGQKFAIWKGAVAQMLQAAGVYSGPRGAEMGDAILNEMDAAFHGESYAPLGIDRMSDDARQITKQTGADPFTAGPQRSAIFETQLSNNVYLPGFKEVRAAARRDKFYYGLGIFNPDTLDKIMQAWKTGVLMRPGFAARVSMDEVLENSLRNGGFGYLEAVGRKTLARGDARRAAAADAQAALEPLAPEERRTVMATQAVASGVPHGMLSQVHNAKELAAAVLAEGAHAAYRVFGGDLTRGDMYNAAKSFTEHVWDSLAPDVSSVAHSGGGYDMRDDIRFAMGEGDKPIPWRVKRDGYSETTSLDPAMRPKWHFALDHIGKSKIGRAVLEHIDDPHEDQVQAAEAVLRDPEFAQQYGTKFARNRQLPDGRMVGRDATHDDAIRSHAEKAVAATNTLVRSSTADGPVLHDVVRDMLRNEGAPDPSTLAAVKNAEMPEGAYGPNFVRMGDFQKLVQTGFRGLSRIIDAISREPITLQAYAQSYKDLLPYARSVMGEGANAEELASDLAARRAMSMVKPYIHNPEVRSQFEVIHRTAMPFLFAQDQWVKRWVRTFVDSPEAIRKAQLLMHGLNVSGFVRPDPTTGQPFFYYPATQTVANIIATVLTKIGIPASLPISVPFTGQVMHLMPGLNNPLTPSVGPMVAVAMKSLAKLFPELEPLNQAVLQEGAAQSSWEQFLPTTLSRLYLAATGNPYTNSEFASSMMKAIQLTEANGHGLPQNASPTQQQGYLDRVTNWTRILFFTKAALGFFTPASPTADFDTANLSPRLTQLFNELPYNQAISEFLRENPNATPYTVFASQETGDVPNLPATRAAGDFMSANRGFINSFPAASGWFMPRTTGKGPFDPAIYHLQISQDMRTAKYPAQFLQDVLMAPSASTYYEALTNEHTALNAATSATARDSIYANFDQWKAQFLSTNPSFADYLSSGGKATVRANTIREMKVALADPRAPQGPQTTHLQTLLQGYSTYEQAFATVDGNYSSNATAYRKTIQTNFLAWATSYVAEFPDASDFFTVVLAPEMGASGIVAGFGNG